MEGQLTNRVEPKTVLTVILAVTVMARLITHASPQMNQPSAESAIAPVLRKEPAIKPAALPQYRYTAGIVTDGPESTDFAIACEIAKALGTGTGPHDEKAVRVTPIVGTWPQSPRAGNNTGLTKVGKNANGPKGNFILTPNVLEITAKGMAHITAGHAGRVDSEWELKEL
jgi:hypothetical protein